MNLKKSLRRLLAALAACSALTAGGMALGVSPPPGFPPTQPGKTTVGVQTADLPPDNLSFTVPLYLTVAAIPSPGGGQIIAPDGYALRNTTAKLPNGSYPDIAVTGLEVSGVAGGTWSLSATPTQAKEVSLTIGGVTLPEVSAASQTPAAADLTAGDNSFYDPAGKGSFRSVPGGPDAEALPLPVSGVLSSAFSADPARAAAQFRVTYTVSLLDGAGMPVGAYYGGPTGAEAAAPAPTPAPTAGP